MFRPLKDIDFDGGWRVITVHCSRLDSRYLDHLVCHVCRSFDAFGERRTSHRLVSNDPIMKIVMLIISWWPSTGLCAPEKLARSSHGTHQTAADFPKPLVGTHSPGENALNEFRSTRPMFGIKNGADHKLAVAPVYGQRTIRLKGFESRVREINFFR